MKIGLRVFIAVFVVLFLNSCENFFPSPLARFNPDDPDVQIKYFSSVASGTESIMTGWLWTDPSPDLDSSQIIDKIRIVHERDSIPDSPFPLNSDNVKEISDKSVWYYEWKDLRSDRNHYFVLYAHERDGGWVKIPKILSQYLNPQGGPDTGYLSLNDQTLSIMNVDRDSDTNDVSDSVLNNADVDETNNVIGFIRFDADYSVGLITSATLTGIDKLNDYPMDIVPVRIRVESGMKWGDLSNPDYYDYSHAVNVTISSSSDTVNITDIMNLARLYETNTIAFIGVSGNTASYDLYNSSISFDFWRQQ